jgi:uncharacterized membrane protein/protein-disulfide isomerase
MVDSHVLLWGIIGTAATCALFSAAIWQSSRSGKRLPGCGQDGSGCDAVVGSRWGYVGPFPVALLGMLAYASAVVGASACLFRASHGAGRAGYELLFGLLPVFLGSAVWFMVIQAAVLRRLCLYCATIHALSIICACLIMLLNERQVSLSARTSVLVAAGAGLVLLMPMSQLVWIPRMYRLDAAASQTRSVGMWPCTAMVEAPAIAAEPLNPSRAEDGRVAKFFGEKVSVAANTWPILGSREITPKLLLFFDFTCNHCRHVHNLLSAFIQDEGGHLSAALVPVPAEGACNRHISCRNPKHAHACAYARLGLAVWLACPTRYAEYDRRMFSGGRPPSVAEAHALANELSGCTLYDPEVVDPVIDVQLQSGIGLFHSLGLQNTPVLLLPNGMLQGHVPTVASLQVIIAKDNGLSLAERDS